MKLIHKLLTGATLILAMAGTSFAQESTIRKNLREAYPTIPTIESVAAADIPGLYEVRLEDGGVLYTDPKGMYMIQGEIVRMHDKVNLTRERGEAQLKGEFKDLSLGDSIKIVKGNGKRQLAVFADPNCGFCKKLEQDMAATTNITVHVFLIPILGASSIERAKNIWCAADRTQVWTDWMVKGTPVATNSCDTAAIDRNLAWAKKARVRATPTLFFADGKRVSGYMTESALEAKLASK